MQEVQRTGPESGETQEQPGEEATHRAQSLHAPEHANPRRVVPQRCIKWPPNSKRSGCQQFEKDVSNILQATARGDTESRLQTMTTIIFSYASERVGQVQKGKAKSLPYSMNRRATKIHQMCQELHILKKQYKTSTAGASISRPDKISCIRRRWPSVEQSGTRDGERGSQEASSLHCQSLRFHNTTAWGHFK